MYKSNDMKLSQFKFELPESLIAQFPASYRDEARLMVLHRKTGEIEHKTLPELVNYFDEGDLFVFNDSKCSRHVCGVTRRKRMRSLRCSCCAN